MVVLSPLSLESIQPTIHVNCLIVQVKATNLNHQFFTNSSAREARGLQSQENGRLTKYQSPVRVSRRRTTPYAALAKRENCPLQRYSLCFPSQPITARCRQQPHPINFPNPQCQCHTIHQHIACLDKPQLLLSSIRLESSEHLIRRQ